MNELPKFRYKIIAEFIFEPLDPSTLHDEVAELLPYNAEWTYERIE